MTDKWDVSDRLIRAVERTEATSGRDDFAVELALILVPWLEPYPAEVKASVLEQIRQLLARYDIGSTHGAARGISSRQGSSATGGASPLGPRDSSAATCPRCGMAAATPSGVGHAILCAMRAAKQDTEQ